MKEKVFLDTNIWVYSAFSGKDPEKHKRSLDFLFDLKKDNKAVWISIQVINEFYSVLLKQEMTDNKIQSLTREILNNVEVHVPDIKSIQSAWGLKIKYQYSYWDCLILASAIESNCQTLFTEDMHHDQWIEKKTRIINPFLEATS